MKLRQKLAMVLASAMIVTAVPVVTFAESTNKLSHPVSSVDGTVVDDKEGLSLIMDFADTILKPSTSFYLESKDFEFSASEYASQAINETSLMDGFGNALAQTTVAEIEKLGLENIDGYVPTGYFSVDEVVYKVTNTTVAVDGFKVTFDYIKGATAPTTRVAADKQVTKTIKLDDFYSVVNNTTLEKDLAAVIAEADGALQGGIEFNKDGEITNPVDPVETTRPGVSPRATVNTTLKIEYLGKDMLRVTVMPNGDTDVKVRIPIYGTVKTGTPTITVDPLDSYATGGTYFLTRESVEDGNRLAVKVADAAPIPVDGGSIADITISEREENSIKAPSTSNTQSQNETIIKNNKVTFELPSSSDLVFAKESVQEKYVRFTGKRAFAPNNEKKASELTNVTFEVSKDGKTLTVGLPTDRAVTTTAGEWIISGIQVLPEETRYDATTGDVNVTIDGEMIKKDTHKVGVVTEYSQAFTAKEVVELYSGKGSKEVEVTLKENVKESLDDKRWAYFELTDGAYIKVDADKVVEDKNGNYSYDIKASEAVKMNINGDDVTYDEDLMQLMLDEDGNVIGFKVQFEYVNDQDQVDVKKGKLNPNKANTIKFKFNVQADTRTTGKVELKADSKAFEVEPLHIANVTAPIEVSFDETTVKVGLEEQKLGKITIKETAAGMLGKGELVIDADEAGVKFVNTAKDLKVTTPEGSTLKVNVKRVDKDGIVLSIDRTAKEASEFTIEGIVADIDRTVPEGKVAIEVFGDSLRAFDGVWGDSVYNEKDGHRPNKGFIYESNSVEEFDEVHRFVKDGYIVVGTKNTEDLPSASQAKEIILTVGSTSYTVNGEAKTSDAAPFIDANNRTMVPVKFVAEEFGKIEFGTINGVGTVTVFKGADVLQFQNGSNIMNKNGIAIPMDTKTVIKDGRTYVPFKFVAQGLGINFSFDDATKSITFTNQEAK